MKDEEIEKYIEAGKIAKKIREEIKEGMIKGKGYLEICNWIEKKIIELGGFPAFPVNLSIDEIAAHDTALPGDGRKVDGKVLKVDFGVHIDGYIVDNALTLVFDKEYLDLSKASLEALRGAIDVIKPGIEVRKIGEIIEDTIKSYGFKPIYNLTGHQVERYNLHAGVSIPNYDNKDRTILEEGMVIAIEPFATNGKGFVRDSGNSGILRLERLKPVRIPSLRKILSFIKSHYNGLPFAKRWLFEEIKNLDVEDAIRIGKSMGMLHEYPRLVEVGGGVVTQHETTVIVYDPPIVLV